MEQQHTGQCLTSSYEVTDNQDEVAMLEAEIEELKFKIERQFEFAKEEIDVRVDSIKVKLEQTREIFFEQLDETQEQMYSHVLNKIESIDSNNQKELEQKQIKILENFDAGVRFITNEIFEKSPQEFIGNFYCNYNSTLLNKISMSKPEYAQLEADVFSIIVLKNGTILTSTYDYRCKEKNVLSLYDTNFKFIKHLTHLNTTKVEIRGMCTDYLKDSIFMIDAQSDSIMKLDQDFNIIKTAKRKWKYAKIACHNDKLYCYYGGDITRVYVHTVVLKFLRIHHFDQGVHDMDISDDIAILNMGNQIKVFRMPNFEMILVFLSRIESTLVLDNRIYFYSDSAVIPYLRVYGMNGCLIDTLFLPNTIKCDYSNHSGIISIGSNLVFYGKRYITKLKIQ